MENIMTNNMYNIDIYKADFSYNVTMYYSGDYDQYIN